MEIKYVYDGLKRWLYIEIIDFNDDEYATVTLSTLDGSIYSSYNLNKAISSIDVSHLPKAKLRVCLETDHKLVVKLLDVVS